MFALSATNSTDYKFNLFDVSICRTVSVTRPLILWYFWFYKQAEIQPGCVLQSTLARRGRCSNVPCREKQNHPMGPVCKCGVDHIFTGHSKGSQEFTALTLGVSQNKLKPQEGLRLYTWGVGVRGSHWGGTIQTVGTVEGVAGFQN